MITIDMLTGRCTDHLVTLGGNHKLQFNATKAFLAMQQAAARAGFKLQSASAFRDFSRQQLIWNEKFTGKRPVLDAHSQPLDISTLTEGERCEAILHWSALPGASRHHWGTEIDVYDPLRIPAGQTLQLEPWEYEAGGYLAELNEWLSENMATFDFYRPFTAKDGGVAYEPWHISYWPLSHQAEQLLTPEVIRQVLIEEDIYGKSWLLANLDSVFNRYIKIPE
ncbi:D-alanyl-D-alanine carboxypeptidase [Providencia rustigianii]|uniref:Serine-type D-Ala-D-Ala carboxypeptidase n=2 Tax=Providencia rustigianii TaxID=158850 RepID=D1P505_9GAMM|nr:M15 family metallopeptidase [Providencia rustigianii]EFB71569.1 serine-type D-Ala-D-Ala carboxypeptidase [Providencia rustigianii DSM 4541]SPY77755.1 D-alanyl-D-alanine carboxypeptidase [Providencia rustigianii]SUC27272.1 D-alanyl-D-alanine carboxypeptidase [Providencia rustigianii]SUC35741.1 D-alanyl-D-alanine carboxypeptidase [Providencia rustigianii]VEB70289.1 D-alanyl-D-alanine carboxypeptidase [Providencia rustigianii]